MSSFSKRHGQRSAAWRSTSSARQAHAMKPLLGATSGGDSALTLVGRFTICHSRCDAGLGKRAKQLSGTVAGSRVTNSRWIWTGDAAFYNARETPMCVFRALLMREHPCRTLRTKLLWAQCV